MVRFWLFQLGRTAINSVILVDLLFLIFSQFLQRIEVLLGINNSLSFSFPYCLILGVLESILDF